MLRKNPDKLKHFFSQRDLKIVSNNKSETFYNTFKKNKNKSSQ